ncbi:hypothetical protein GCM10027091_74070 [Streptomyces daliensis]
MRRRVQLPIRQLHALEHHRHRARICGHPVLEQLHQRRIRHIRVRVIPPGHQQLALVHAEHIHRTQRDVRAAVHDIGERVDEVLRRGAQQAPQCLRVVGVGGLHAEAQPARAPVVDGHSYRIVRPVLAEDGAGPL